MPLYPETISRCTHIKVNGTQCGSPSLLRHKFCYFHKQWRQKHFEINSNIQRTRRKIILPMLEDANSTQMGLVQVMRLLVTQQIDHRTAALLLYALQTASTNLKHTSFEPEQPTQVVIDRECVAFRPIGATAWSAEEGREFDELQKDDLDKNKKKARKDDAESEPMSQEGREFMAELTRLSEGVARDPGFLDKRMSELQLEEEKKAFLSKTNRQASPVP